MKNRLGVVWSGLVWCGLGIMTNLGFEIIPGIECTVVTKDGRTVSEADVLAPEGSDSGKEEVESSRLLRKTRICRKAL